MTAKDLPIAVRDRKNPDRLLGWLCRRPVSRLNGSRIQCAVAPKRTLRPWSEPLDPCEPVEFPRVTFTVSWRTSPDGWQQTAELLTDDPLGVLLMLDLFRLPGESEEQAAMRRYHA